MLPVVFALAIPTTTQNSPQPGCYARDGDEPDTANGRFGSSLGDGTMDVLILCSPFCPVSSAKFIFGGILRANAPNAGRKTNAYKKRQPDKHLQCSGKTVAGHSSRGCNPFAAGKRTVKILVFGHRNNELIGLSRVKNSHPGGLLF